MPPRAVLLDNEEFRTGFAKDIADARRLREALDQSADPLDVAVRRKGRYRRSSMWLEVAARVLNEGVILPRHMLLHPAGAEMAFYGTPKQDDFAGALSAVLQRMSDVAGEGLFDVLKREDDYNDAHADATHWDDITAPAAADLLSPENRKAFGVKLLRRFVDSGVRVLKSGIYDQMTGCRFAEADGKYRIELDPRHWLDRELIRREGYVRCLERAKLLGRTQTDYAPQFLDFSASTKQECEEIVHRIESTLEQEFGIAQLWLRGQRQEYFITRDPDVAELIGYGKAGWRLPSLIPSLGRLAQKVQPHWRKYLVASHAQHTWTRAFFVYLSLRNGSWFGQDKVQLKRLKDALQDDDAFVSILAERMSSGRLPWPDEADDFWQWFTQGLLYEPFVWVLQQYGCPASILDVTSDLDVALFFTEAKIADGRVLLTEPCDTRIIYVFVESVDSECFVSESKGIWASLDSSGVGVPDRIRAQRCGYLKGASFLRQNQYANLIVARIHLNGSSRITSLQPEDLFPDRASDLLYATLSRARPVPEGLY